nr:hypothetical protein [Tanacetum cinerariifolium]
MEERLVNGWMIIQRDFDELKTKLEKVRYQISELQKKHLGQKDKIAFARFRISNLEQALKDIQSPPTMTQAAIRRLSTDSVAATLEAQAATMENTNNTNRNTRPSETLVARKGTNDHKRKFNDRRNTTNNDNKNYPNNCDNNNYPNDRNNNNHSNNRNNNKYHDNRNNDNCYNDYHHQQDIRILHCQESDLQQGGSSDQELQKQRTSYGKQSAISICNLSYLWRERALQKSMLKNRQ